MRKKLIDIARSTRILFQDWILYEFSQANDDKYLKMCNRMERVSPGPGGKGFVCLWPYTSKLDAVSVWPFLGKRLLNRCLQDYSFINTSNREVERDVEISVLIGHRGIERLTHLIATLGSIASQKGVAMECIVIEQDVKPQIKDRLPNWVKYVFQKSNNTNLGYNRSAAFNLGCRVAKGKVLILHDNDMLVPTDYCNEILSIVNMGYDAVNIKRFTFYLNEKDSEDVKLNVGNIGEMSPAYVVQNLEAGGSVGITKEGYLQIGGMDERFVGWGGEDNEFWGRCATLSRWIWGYVPLVHLWHVSQPLKTEKNNPNLQKAKEIMSVPLNNRIEELKRLNDLVVNDGSRYVN